VLTDDLTAHADRVLMPDGRILGPKLGKTLRDVMAAARSGAWTLEDDGRCTLAGLTLDPGEFELRLKSHEGALSGALKANDMVVVLDDQVTPALRAEGMARDVVRFVQSARKDADLVITDRIALTLDLPAPVLSAVQAHEAYVCEQVLATDLTYAPVDGDDHTFEGQTEGHTVRGGLRPLPSRPPA
jgi:isoleucyl-tRNA synthetase